MTDCIILTSEISEVERLAHKIDWQSELKSESLTCAKQSRIIVIKERLVNGLSIHLP